MEFKKRLADTDWTERQVLVIIEKQIEKKEESEGQKGIKIQPNQPNPLK